MSVSETGPYVGQGRNIVTGTLAIVAVNHKDDTLGVLVVMTPEWTDLQTTATNDEDDDDV